jgi:hypothetical protein
MQTISRDDSFVADSTASTSPVVPKPKTRTYGRAPPRASRPAETEEQTVTTALAIPTSSHKPRPSIIYPKGHLKEDDDDVIAPTSDHPSPSEDMDVPINSGPELRTYGVSSTGTFLWKEMLKTWDSDEDDSDVEKSSSRVMKAPCQ